MKIVVDAMGGDRAPEVPIKGAVLAANELGCGVILVGCEKTIKGVLGKCRGSKIGRARVGKECRSRWSPDH